MHRLLSPELYGMLLCHNYENVSIHILLEDVCLYVMFLYLIDYFYWIVIVFYDALSEITK